MHLPLSPLHPAQLFPSNALHDAGDAFQEAVACLCGRPLQLHVNELPPHSVAVVVLELHYNAALRGLFLLHHEAGQLPIGCVYSVLDVDSHAIVGASRGRRRRPLLEIL